jgi:hypothetical protein
VLSPRQDGWTDLAKNWSGHSGQVAKGFKAKKYFKKKLF